MAMMPAKRPMLEAGSEAQIVGKRSRSNAISHGSDPSSVFSSGNKDASSLDSRLNSLSFEVKQEDADPSSLDDERSIRPVMESLAATPHVDALDGAIAHPNDLKRSNTSECAAPSSSSIVDTSSISTAAPLSSTSTHVDEESGPMVVDLPGEQIEEDAFDSVLDPVVIHAYGRTDQPRSSRTSGLRRQLTERRGAQKKQLAPGIGWYIIKKKRPMPLRIVQLRRQG